MATKEKISTEKRILLAAKKVFTQKGYDATKTRDIAEEAGINIASLHYYFRSKEKLFQIIIKETMFHYSNMINHELNGQKPLHQKIRRFIEKYINFILANPFVPMFITAESHRNAKEINEMIGGEDIMPVLEAQLADLSKRGIIRPTTVGDFFCDVIGLASFPLICKPILEFKTGITEEEYLDMMERRKEKAADMIINYIYLKPPNELE